MEYREYKMRGASRVPMFIIFTVIGALFVIIIIQPLGVVAGLTVIGLFIAGWMWFVISLLRESLDRPRSLAFDGDGLRYRTRRHDYRIPWQEVESAVEITAPPAPRAAPISRLTLFCKTPSEIWFSEAMLSCPGKGSRECYEEARAVIAGRLDDTRRKGF